MIAVLDVSAAISICLDKPGTQTQKKTLINADVVIAPDLYVSEVTNVAWKYSRMAKFSQEMSISLADNGLHLVDYFIPSIDLWKESLKESITYAHPVYDLLYVVTARRNNGILLTNDSKLKATCKRLNVTTL